MGFCRARVDEEEESFTLSLEIFSAENIVVLLSYSGNTDLYDGGSSITSSWAFSRLPLGAVAGLFSVVVISDSSSSRCSLKVSHEKAAKRHNVNEPV